MRPAGWGTDHPGIGTCKLHGGCLPNHQIAAARRQAMVAFHHPRPVDPATALLECVQLAAGQVAYAGSQLDRLETEGQAGLETNKALFWQTTQNEAIDRLARYSKMALDAGAAEKQVRIAERWGAELAEVVKAVFRDLELTEEQEVCAPEIVRRHLLSLERGTAGDSSASWH